MNPKQIYNAIVANSREYRENMKRLIKAAEAGNEIEKMIYVDIERHLNRKGVDLRKKLPIKSIIKRKEREYENQRDKT